MTTYRIVDIKHTGELGKAGDRRTDSASLGRIGRHVLIEKDDIMIGLSLFMPCTYAPGWDGDPYFKSLRTSPVSYVQENQLNKNLIVTTKNSHYELEPIE